MTKITSNTTTTPTTTPSAPVEATEPATKPKADTAPTKKECAPDTPRDTWETAKDEKSEGFFSKLGQKIDKTIDDAASTVKDAGKTIKQTMDDATTTVKDARDNVQKVATDAINDGIDNIQQRANDAVDNFQQGIDNVQKKTNDTIDALQDLDSQTVKDVATKRFIEEPIQAVKDFAIADTIKPMSPSDRKEVISKAISIVAEQAPILLKEVQQTSQTIIEETEKIISKCTQTVIQETLKTIESGKETYAETMKSLAQRKQKNAYEKMEQFASHYEKSPNLLKDLLFSGAKLLSDNEAILRKSLDTLNTINSSKLNQHATSTLKEHASTDQNALIDVLEFIGSSSSNIVELQTALLHKAGSSILDVAVTAHKKEEAIREAMDFVKNAETLEPGDSQILNLDIEMTGVSGFGIVFGASDNVTLTREIDPESTMATLNFSTSEFTGGAVGGKGQTEGLEGSVSKVSQKSYSFQFDLADPNSMKELQTALFAKWGGMPPADLVDALPTIVDEISTAKGSNISTSFGLLGNTLSKDHTTMLTFSQKNKPDGPVNILSASTSVSLDAGTPRLQLPDVFKPEVDSTDNNTIVDIKDFVAGKNIGEGLLVSSNIELVVQVELPKGSIDLKDVKSISVEATGMASRNADSINLKSKLEILNPVELALGLNMTKQQLISDLKSGSLDATSLTDKMLKAGMQLDKHITFEVSSQKISENTTHLNGFGFNFKAGRVPYNKPDMIYKFPPEVLSPKPQLDAQATTPQPSLQQDAADAELRLLDRAFQA